MRGSSAAVAAMPGTGEAQQASVSSQGGGARSYFVPFGGGIVFDLGCVFVVVSFIIVGADFRQGFPRGGAQGAGLRSGR